MERQEPRQDALPTETPATPEKRTYQPPKVEAVRLSSEAAEALT